jgi:DNA polymerase-3 subunit gamma/tau
VREPEPVKRHEVTRPAPAAVREDPPAPVAVTAPAPAPVAREPDPIPEPEPAPAPEPKAAVSTADFWPDFVSLVQQRRPLAVSWLHSASLLGITGKVVKVGFPSTESFARDSLMRPAQLSFLESLAEEVLGQAMKFELVLDASLKAPEFSEIGLGLLDEPAPPPPKLEPKPAAKAEPEPKAAPAEESAAPQADSEFYNDPLIQKAMVKFKARLVPAG